MAIVQFDVDSYTLWLSPALGYGTENIAYPALIICWGKKDRCTFRFVDKSQLPQSRYDQSTRKADVFVHASQYPWYVDLLRHERPVRCSINTSDPRSTVLSTGQETVGEGEQVIRV